MGENGVCSWSQDIVEWDTRLCVCVSDIQVCRFWASDGHLWWNVNGVDVVDSSPLPSFISFDRARVRLQDRRDLWEGHHLDVFDLNWLFASLPLLCVWGPADCVRKRDRGLKCFSFIGFKEDGEEVQTLAPQCNHICQHDPFLSAFELSFDSLISLCPGTCWQNVHCWLNKPLSNVYNLIFLIC